MQSIDDIARAISELTPAERQALMEKLAHFDVEVGGDRQRQLKIQAVTDAMNDKLFLADLNEVMEDFRHIDTEESLG